MTTSRTAWVLLLLAVLGCAPRSGHGGGGGGSASGSGSSGAGGGGPAGGTAASRAHWQVALAALGQSTSPGPVTLEQPAFDAWNEMIARSWPGVRPLVDDRVRALLAQIAAPSGAVVAIRSVSAVTIDTAAPPAVFGSRAGTAGQIELQLPRAPAAWRVAFTATIGATIPIQIAGVSLPIAVSFDVDVDISDVRVAEAATLDLSNPQRPAIGSTGAPQVTLTLSLRSTDPLLAQVLNPLTQLLDPLVRAALVAGAAYAQQEIGALLAQVPWTPWGAGAPPAAAIPGAPPLGPLAERIADEIQRDHMPFDTVFPAIFDQPTYGSGAVVGYFDHGDSPCWTGHYLASEALRWDLTGDPRALAGATRALRGLAACLEIAAPGDGLLSRCAVPLASPFVVDIQGNQDYFTGVVNGVPMGGIGDISRDQYLGTFMGATQAWLRIPQLRPQAAEIMSRSIAYLDRNGWNAYKPHTTELSRASPFAQTPGVIWAFVSAGALVDPARFGALHARWKDVTSILWLNAWGSSVEVHESYYKFCLQHAELMIDFATETDPARYRDYVKVLDVTRAVVGDHQNAWFDAVYGMGVPAAAPLMGSRVKVELDRWALRPRRGFDAVNSQDPSIANAVYSSPTNLSGAQLYATEPVPIEKRPPNDYLWQIDPFKLDRGMDPHWQYPGVDLVLPYWVGRAYGMVR